MTKQMIIDAYCKIRTIDNTIPDDVLDFMKNTALAALTPSYKIGDRVKIIQNRSSHRFYIGEVITLTMKIYGGWYGQSDTPLIGSDSLYEDEFEIV